MKKSAWIWAVVVCWILCVMPVKADVIWEPMDDFYEEHREECRYVNRNFTANGPDGEVIVYKSPENPTVVDTWENGFSAYISFVYTDELIRLAAMLPYMRRGKWIKPMTEQGRANLDEFREMMKRK